MGVLDTISVIKISDIVNVFSKQGTKFKMENRKTYGLSFCIEGKITYKHNGKIFISDSNSIVIIPKDESYELYRNETGNFALIDFLCTDDFFTDEFIEIPSSNNKLLFNHFEYMKKQSIYPENKYYLLSLFYELLHNIYLENENFNNMLIPAIKYIRLNLNNPSLKNKDIAQSINVSEVYLYKLFSFKYGISPKQYILNLRINFAKQLLTDNRNSIALIAEKCGFSSIYNFSRAFKSHTGISPSQYRISHIRTLI